MRRGEGKAAKEGAAEGGAEAAAEGEAQPCSTAAVHVTSSNSREFC